MSTDTADLIHQLAIEYNALIFTTSSNNTQRDVNSINESDTLTCTNLSESEESESEDEIDSELQEIKDEIVMLMLSSSRKRGHDFADNT